MTLPPLTDDLARANALAEEVIASRTAWKELALKSAARAQLLAEQVQWFRASDLARENDRLKAQLEDAGRQSYERSTQAAELLSRYETRVKDVEADAPWNILWGAVVGAGGLWLLFLLTGHLKP